MIASAEPRQTIPVPQRIVYESVDKLTSTESGEAPGWQSARVVNHGKKSIVTPDPVAFHPLPA